MERINHPRGAASEITSPAHTTSHDPHTAEAPPANPPTTYTEAIGHSPYDLLRELHDHALSRFAAQEEERDQPEHHLAELALSAAAMWWWRHWQPLMMHRAFKAGASLGEVAAAAGTTEAEVYGRWASWANSQTWLVIGEQPSLDTSEAEAVREHIRRTTTEKPWA